jgi:hypothetical protein
MHITEEIVGLGKRLFDFMFQPVLVERARVRYKRQRASSTELVHRDAKMGAGWITIPQETVLYLQLGHRTVEVLVDLEKYHAVRRDMPVRVFYQVGRFSRKIRVHEVKKVTR